MSKFQDLPPHQKPAAPVPPGRKPGEALFEDDFNDGLDDLWEQTLGKWQVANQ
jgi:hypothetical protein